MSASMNKTESLAIAFGEVLFDCFEDSTCLGGAPLKFAQSLSQFGISVALVSAIECGSVKGVYEARQAVIEEGTCRSSTSYSRVLGS